MTQETWTLWDAQERRRIAKLMEDQAYVWLNNLYLSIERGDTELTITTAGWLCRLAGKVYHSSDPMLDWWRGEFQKLPGWENV